LGEVSQIEGLFPEAEVAFTKAVALLNRYAGPRDIRTASALNTLGRLYNVTGRSKEAVVTLDKAWRMAQTILPEDSPDLVPFLDSQASLFCQNSRFTEAEKLWLRAVQVAEKAYGPAALEYSGVLTHLGEMYSSIGDYKSAENLFKRSLKGYERDGVELSVPQAIMMSQLGGVYTKMKSYSAAQPLFARSIEIVNADGNRAPLGAALVLSSAGDYSMARRDWVTAEQDYRRALQLREKTLGDHPLVAQSLRSLSNSLRKLNRKQEAKDNLVRANQILAVQTDPAYAGETVDVRAFRTK
jgi:tetratricopeptide (TPR) repeat protein